MEQEFTRVHSRVLSHEMCGKAGEPRLGGAVETAEERPAGGPAGLQTQLGSHYSGSLDWGGHTLPIRWSESGTLDDDHDHIVVLIKGEGVSLHVVWGWMESARGRVGAYASVDQVAMPDWLARAAGAGGRASGHQWWLDREARHGNRRHHRTAARPALGP